MKKKLFIHFLIALFCCWITVGLAANSTIVYRTLIFLFTTVAVCTTLSWIKKLVRYIYNSKKKIKDKRIKIKVQFISKDEPKPRVYSQTFSSTDFTQCMKNIFRYAKIYKCCVESMTLLTTEE